MDEGDKLLMDNLNTKPDFCADCGTALRGTDEICPHCGLWLEAHDDTIIHDAEEARKRAEAYSKMR